MLPCQEDAVAKARCCFDKGNTGGNVLFWEVGAQKRALWVLQVMLLCVYMPSVSADLLVNRFLFCNLIFWILCHDVVVHVRIKTARLLLVCTPTPSRGLGAPEDFKGGFEGALLQTAFPVLWHCSVPWCWWDAFVAPL